MKDLPKETAEAEELAMFFQRLARSSGDCLRITGGPFRDFVVKPISEAGEEEGPWMTVNLSDKSVNAVRLERRCGTPTLHELLTQLGVPHEFDKNGTKELRISLRHARKIEEAWGRLDEHIDNRIRKDREEGSAEIKQSSSHSRS
jgi:hypothetical protein